MLDKCQKLRKYLVPVFLERLAFQVAFVNIVGIPGCNFNGTKRFVKFLESAREQISVVRVEVTH